MDLMVVVRVAVFAVVAAAFVYAAFWVKDHPEFVEELGDKIKKIFKR